LASLTAAIKAESGFTPSFDCSGSNLNAVAYYFHLRGSIIDGAFQQISAYPLQIIDQVFKEA
jgi:ribonuclease T2